MTNLRLYFLGPAHCRRDAHPLDLSSAKAIALLGYLAVTAAPQRREHLIDLLWPTSAPDAARKNLRNRLWSIRKKLGDDIIATEADQMTLPESVWHDVGQLESAAESLAASTVSVATLQAAADLYRGPLLDGLDLLDAPDFELWLSTERERLGQLYMRLLAGLVDLHRAEAAWPKIIAVARRAIAYDPLQEPMARALMESHARLGERSEALRQYDLLQTILAQELGVDPLPETEDLRQAILDDALPPLPSSPVVVAPSSPPASSPTAPSVARPFVGRETERAALDEAFDLARSGQAQVALLSGELGIGKSRLWQEWAASLPPESLRLETRCLDTTQALPFAPVTDLLRQPHCFANILLPPTPLSPVWLTELVRLLPEIRPQWPALPDPPTLLPEEECRRLFEALTQTILALNEQPLILFFDDLHWVDQASLDWLLYLLNRLRHRPLLLVGTYRPQDAPPRLVNVVATWQREGLARRLLLPALTPPEATDLVTALGGDRSAADRLFIQSGGNPYFLLELYGSESDGPPPRLADLIRSRLDRLPPVVRQVLQAAAILEANFDLLLLRRVCGRGEAETLDALDALLEANILTERSSGYEFVHPLVATVVRAGLSQTRRRFLHRRAAEALSATQAGLSATVAGQAAQHYAQADQPAEAAHYADLAAQNALDLAAPAEAVTFYRQALSLEATPARRLGLGQALFAQGDLAGARAAYQQALTDFEATTQQAEAGPAYLLLAESYLPSGEGPEVIRWAEAALPHLEAEANPRAAAHAHFLLGAGGLRTGRSLAEAETHLRTAARLAETHALADLRARVHLELGNLLAQRGDVTAALEIFEATIALAAQAGDRFWAVLGHNNLAYHALLVDELPTARNHIDLALTQADSYGLLLPRQYLYSTRGEVALAEGQVEEADRWFRQALTEAEAQRNQAHIANIRANVALVARQRGDLDTAHQQLTAAQESLTGVTEPYLQTKLDLWRAELSLQRGDRAGAEAILGEVETRLAQREWAGLQRWLERLSL